MPWMEKFAVPMVCVSQVVMFAVLGACQRSLKRDRVGSKMVPFG
jgi:hypothetical protein